jgi:hypothetical protein
MDLLLEQPGQPPPEQLGLPPPLPEQLGLPPPPIDQLGLPPPPLEQLGLPPPVLDQLGLLDALLLVEMELELDPLLDPLDLLLLHCWSSFAAKREKEKSEVLCVCFPNQMDKINRLDKKDTKKKKLNILFSIPTAQSNYTWNRCYK